MTNVLEWLEHMEGQAGEKIAVADPKEKYSFTQLKTYAQKSGTYLRKWMTGTFPVAIYMEKSCATLSIMLGAVYAGCPYCLLDLRQPDVRLRQILKVLQPEVIVTKEENLEKIRNCVGEMGGDVRNTTILLAENCLNEMEMDQKLLKQIRKKHTDRNPLYINFTSGSTGLPKGVAVSHRAVIDFIRIYADTFDITKEDIIGNQAPFDFDVSVKDIYTGLLTGAKVQIIPREYFSDPTTLMDYMADSKMTVLTWAVSAMCFVSVMNGFDYRTPDTVRKVLFSGEVLPVKHYRVWKKYLPQAMFVNLYGPTEVTCNCTYYVLDPADKYELTDVIPIGKSFPNERVFLLDETDQEVTEAGMNGEICVSSSELALGYYNAPDKTAQVFVQNPLNHLYDERIYRTGDLAKYDAEGNLVYISRKDFQIKHLGHRIELGEIEVAANAVNGISRSCCIYEAEKERLLLFYTGECEKRQLIKLLRGALPPYMIPNMALRLAEMPMTKNGKIDRNKLMKLYEESLHARHFKK
ncbi:D-alanine--poly(phosphoribitol) ligase [Eubacterium ramulus]|uniref:amino acid adenylation domain-containing protein n=1 Tax=Eubacterium ramulus TaxID=39490 RepID=UPI00102183E6|nr:amino acid adenylation domain-containing protein [Eubacterium ramulus]MSC76694.1 AMP-binding protein [Eubacterium ramulus]MSC92746.1 AMP-binding protein [Eubacterium ramulus]RYS99693.1 D-alanine--poly(phosphoribitol) ligase [Eubacterium ramulus]